MQVKITSIESFELRPDSDSDRAIIMAMSSNKFYADPLYEDAANPPVAISFELIIPFELIKK